MGALTHTPITILLNMALDFALNIYTSIYTCTFMYTAHATALWSSIVLAATTDIEYGQRDRTCPPKYNND